jgi:hypothetical protein
VEGLEERKRRSRVSVEDSMARTLTGLLIKLLASMSNWESSSAGELFKLDFEPPDVTERVFVELEVERLRQHVFSCSLKREERFLGFPSDNSVLGLYFLIPTLCFMSADSLE